VTANGRDASGAAALTTDGAAGGSIEVLAAGVEGDEAVSVVVEPTLAESLGVALAAGVVPGSAVVPGDDVALGADVGLGSGVGSA